MFDVLPTPLRVFALALVMIGGVARAEDPAGQTASAEIRHPVVPGFERFHNGNDPASTANPVEGGLLLLGELACVSCHAPGPAVASQVVPKQAPILDKVGSRVRPGYLRAFLSDPHAVKPGTTMPHLFAALPAEEKAATVEALVHFLATTGTVTEKEIDPKAIAGGKKLYHEIGCVACHGRRDRTAPRLAASLPLGDLGRKYTLPGLTTFLQDPLKVRPTGRMPALNLVKNESTDVASYLLDGPADTTGKDAADAPFPLDRDLAEKGRAVFERVGCASCHQLRAGDGVIASTLTAPPLSALTGGRDGCIALAHGSSGLMYRLDDRQRLALGAALKAVVGGKLPAPTPRTVVDRTMTALNCYACHVRDGRGGVEEARQEFFKTTQHEMGDEGRIPPSLDGVGAKLRPEYMKRYFDVGVKDRPYMLTRMPRFGAANLTRLTTAFAELDPLQPVVVPTFAESPRRVKSIGRFLAGGEALGCIKCHTFKGIESEGVQAVDMAVMTRRLRRDWFHRYLVDTQAYRPGTRMPTGWPGGKTMLPLVADGDTGKQIEALWEFLSDGSDATEPYGLGREPVPLVPEAEAIIYRNFIKGAGTRAIGVGYPEHVNLAFDANELRLALLWQGAFIDASRHWSGRSVGFQPPLGDNVLSLAAGPDFASLPDMYVVEPWPKIPAKAKGDAFRGYRLSHDGRPTFLYEVGGLLIADYPEAVPGANPKVATLRRTVTVTVKPGQRPPFRPLVFRAIAARRIQPQGDGLYTIDGEWKLRVQPDAGAVLRKSEGMTELLVPVGRAGDLESKVVQEFVW